MSVRAVNGSLGLICALGLAVVGVGWHAEERPQPLAQDEVYCDLDKLAHYHPAWEQFIQVSDPRALPRVGQTSGSDSTGIDAVNLSLPNVRTHIEEKRAGLKSRLEERATEELGKVSDQLNASLQRQLTERRRDLESQANATDAEARRRSDQEFTQALRAIDEERRFERVDIAIKLAALKSQLAVQACATDRVKAAIQAKESDLDRVRAELAQEEENLRDDVARRLAGVRADQRNLIKERLAELERQELERMGDLLREQRERLHRDIRGDGAFEARNLRPLVKNLTYVGNGAAKRAIVARTAGEAGFSISAARSKTGVSEFADGLRDRARSEVEAIVKRIARENGLKITFQPGSGTEDRTQWFRERLPYLTARKSG